MKKTIGFLKEKGIIDEIQELVDFAPSNIVKDMKDPNMKGLQKYYILHMLSDMDSDEFYEFLKAVADDIIYTLNIKKQDKEGDKITGLIIEIIKELGK